MYDISLRLLMVFESCLLSSKCRAARPRRKCRVGRRAADVHMSSASVAGTGTEKDRTPILAALDSGIPCIRRSPPPLGPASCWPMPMSHWGQIPATWDAEIVQGARLESAGAHPHQESRGVDKFDSGSLLKSFPGKGAPPTDNTLDYFVISVTTTAFTALGMGNRRLGHLVLV